MSKMRLCPCNSNDMYQACCGPFIQGKAKPITPEALMRSRYCAYHDGVFDYIVDTMKAPASKRFNLSQAKRRAKKMQWVDLKVVKASTQEKIGYVEFIASFKTDQTICQLHEISEFHLRDGSWYYVDGVFVNTW